MDVVPGQVHRATTITTSSFHGVERKEVYLKYLPVADRIEFTPTEKKTFVLLKKKEI